jgi:large conductance mechanosensitive channel
MIERKSIMSLAKEFKEFAMKGNVVDMAVGIVIGAAFTKIVSSLVADVIMPPLGLLLGGLDFSKHVLEIQGPKGPVDIRYGAFLNSVVDFLIVALAIFAVVKAMNALKRKQEASTADAPPAPKQEVLLTEIRDLLKQRA